MVAMRINLITKLFQNYSKLGFLQLGGSYFQMCAICRYKGDVSWTLPKHLLLQWGGRKPGLGFFSVRNRNFEEEGSRCRVTYCWITLKNTKLDRQRVVFIQYKIIEWRGVLIRSLKNNACLILGLGEHVENSMVVTDRHYKSLKGDFNRSSEVLTAWAELKRCMSALSAYIA